MNSRRCYSGSIYLYQNVPCLFEISRAQASLKFGPLRVRTAMVWKTNVGFNYFDCKIELANLIYFKSINTRRTATNKKRNGSQKKEAGFPVKYLGRENAFLFETSWRFLLHASQSVTSSFRRAGRAKQEGPTFLHFTRVRLRVEL